jgi:hypothetical protein
MGIERSWQCSTLDTNYKDHTWEQSISSLRIINEVTALACLRTMTHVGIGLENGVVILIRGDISKDKHTKSRIIYEGGEMITCLGFLDDGVQISLYIVTTAKILFHKSGGKDCVRLFLMQIELESVSSELGNALLSPHDKNQDIILAKNDAVYFYGPEGKGPSFLIKSMFF